ncbi:MAG: tetratricopeptide (TPR) repeat protein [Arenicella sp.]|jgi:tetratricopeptide (TPR) repeat protein
MSDQHKILHQAKLKLQQGQLDEAVNSLKTLLKVSPAHRDALYYLAVCQRRQNDNQGSLNSLTALISSNPEYGRAYQERGYNYEALGQTHESNASFQTAVEKNAALLASWKKLKQYYRDSQLDDKAHEASQHVQWLTKLPPQLRTVSSLIHEEKLFIAEQICRQYLKENPHHGEAMRLLAEIGGKLQILDDAEFLLESCVEFYPDYQRARLDYVQVLHRRQKFGQALQQAQILNTASPENTHFEIALASENQAVGNFEQALAIYQRVIDRNNSAKLPNRGDNHAVYAAQGHALKTIGRTDQAIDSYRSAYQRKADFGDAYWSLANLKTYQFTEAELSNMRSQVDEPKTSNHDKVQLCFALGKALEDRQEFAESFEFYQRGNTLKRQQSQYRPERIEAEFELQKKIFKQDFFADHQSSGFESRAPIFIVGLPRAGSTLLEQILASHSQVDGTMELANIIGLAHRLGGRRTAKQGGRYPSILTEMTDQNLRKFGEDFIKDTQIHRQGGAFFIDKMPNNFRHIPLIRSILPNAKIIDARREPMACCFSGFKQLFAEGQEFTYGLDLIGRYYSAYIDLMAHWDHVQPGAILRVQHEDVLLDLESQVRRILDYCELPFEQQCLEFHKTERAVRTPSSEQVRQPIYTTAMQQWENYDEFLQPLKDNLS